MTNISQAMLWGAFGTRNVGESTAKTAGIKTEDFKKYDTDKDNKLSLGEILGNEDICNKLLTRINAIQAVLTQTENEEVALKNKQQGEQNLLKESTEKYPEFDGFNVRERNMVLVA